MPGFVREWSIRLGLLLLSTIIALLLAEVAVRIFYPISDGRDNVTLEGEPIKQWFPPGTVYRQVANEYDVITTITDKGHRVPEVKDNPDVIFIGDSFTFGWGIKDEDTFVSIYCTSMKLQCANLGQPGSGTDRQLNRLQKFLDKWNWKPKEVKLFFFGMSGSFSAGNDFVDNYNHGRWLKSREIDEKDTITAEQEEYQPGLVERIINMRMVIQENSNLIRVIKFHLGGWLRSLAVVDPGKERMSEALAYTREYLQKFDKLSKQYGFTYNIYLLVPVQDVMRGTYNDTLDTLNSISPKQAIATAQIFLDSPQSYYFAYDGHINTNGSRKIAEFLIDREQK